MVGASVLEQRHAQQHVVAVIGFNLAPLRLGVIGIVEDQVAHALFVFSGHVVRNAEQVASFEQGRTFLREPDKVKPVDSGGGFEIGAQ